MTVRMTMTTRAVLAAFLADLGRAWFGYDLMQEANLGSGTLYPILARLEGEGWLVGEMEPGTSSELGREPRRYYRLTDRGLVEAKKALVEKGGVRPRLPGPPGVPKQHANGDDICTIIGCEICP